MAIPEGYATAIITNNVAEFGDGWRGLLPVDELFDAVIDSCEVGIRKPDPRIFEIAMERMQVTNPAEAVFLDDYPANVAAAEALGLNTVLVDADMASVIARLDEALAG